MANGSAEALNEGVLLFLYKCKRATDFSPVALDSYNWSRGDSSLPVCEAVWCLSCPGCFSVPTISASGYRSV